MAEDKAGDPDCPAGADEWFATEQDLVRQWAGERGTLFTRREFLYGLKEAGLGEPLEGGNEHDIIPPIEGGFWFLKITNTPGGYGARGHLHIYLRNLLSANALFGDNILLLCAVEDTDKPGQVIKLVTAQPAVRGEMATEEQISRFMESMGFLPHQLYPHVFTHSCGTMIFDARGANMLVDDQGHVMPIDVQIKHVEKYMRWLIVRQIRNRFLSA